ncbi:30S ribosomal protein S3 [Candidatus Wolfebacteria bacterium RIFCSPLOWO2_01_FULL_38_11]|uniref:Small ribosomal subunit protein uS3 n=3 Tax=root TaxID=1 RepID=A0A0G0IGJ1_9BACT|nr:30S ribosomal protein S3 [uncultured organism]KKQ23329.1 MAG: 30S ribosomal protein S3 [Candidatus Wolfebacteria bacterium GW2011_GWC1_37_10]OGM91358.1 MAG: 30S ribosomal protein S3 [Candidatus Wolfebacteria bacterium RIFCSPLOWO2_01_FULL_38_11]
MGHKIRPTSLRLGIINDWSSRWFPKRLDFKNLLEEDVMIREIISKKISTAGIDKVEIERTGNKYRVSIKVSRPGLVIGRGGKGVEDLTKLLESAIKKIRMKKGIKEPVNLSLNIEEVKRSDVSAAVIAQNIAWDFEKRMPFRRTIKKYIEQIMQNRDVKGAKIMVGGRLDGAEIARTETLTRGRLPLTTLRANIDYGLATAFTTYGTIGVKVWIYKGEIFNK